MFETFQNKFLGIIDNNALITVIGQWAVVLTL